MYYRRYEDNAVTIGQIYTYTVSAVLGDIEGKLSPPFIYTHSNEYCGNGRLER